MPFDSREMDLQQQFFRTKLAAEKQKKEVVDQVKLGRGEFVLLDARDPASFDKGHIPGARSLPIDRVAELANALPPDREYVVYCWTST